MAFLDFSVPLAGTATSTCARPKPPRSRAATQPAFTSEEWQIMQLAREDGLGSLNPHGKLARWRDLIFGARHNPRLADPRLEALRRLAVEAWYRSFAVSQDAIDDFLSAGFSPHQLELALATISSGRRGRGLWSQ